MGTAQGVYGVGLDILNNDQSTPYFAFITFGDDTTLNHALPAGTSYFGITDPLLIKSIHFGLSGGGATTAGSFLMDNLTIAAAGAQFPEPASVMLLGSAFAALAMLAASAENSSAADFLVPVPRRDGVCPLAVRPVAMMGSLCQTRA